MIKKLLFIFIGLFGLNAFAFNPTQGPLQQDPSLCSYGYNPNCNRGGSSYYEQPQIITTYYTPYLVMLYSKDSTPIFFRERFYFLHQNDHFSDIEMKVMRDMPLEECNRNSELAPCRSASLLVIGEGCIVVVESEHKFYADQDYSCQAAENTAMSRCNKTDQSPNSCQVYTHEYL